MVWEQEKEGGDIVASQNMQGFCCTCPSLLSCQTSGWLFFVPGLSFSALTAAARAALQAEDGVESQQESTLILQGSPHTAGTHTVRDLDSTEGRR